MAKLTTFNKLYRQLNQAQKAAVDTIDGPVMVIAGPGTGKTQVLTLRIANILRQTDTPPDAILALAFTKSAVNSLRRRLAEIIGPAAYRVGIFTFHGFCERIIQTYPEAFPRIIGGRPVDRAGQLVLLEQIITSTRLKLLKPYGHPFYYCLPVLTEIDHLKRENIPPVDLQKLLITQKTELEATGRVNDLKTIAKNQEFRGLYEKYETALRAEHLYDYGDMVMEVIHELERSRDFRLSIEEKYQYVLADEHQDANQSQNRLLELLTSFHANPNLFIVGDEKQAIFQFQGASLDNFNYFRRRHKQAKVVTLINNYRSSQVILDSALSLIKKSGTLGPQHTVRLQAATKRPAAPLVVRRFATEEGEASFVAAEIKQKIAAGVPAEALAILYRDNKDAGVISRALEAVGVPYSVFSDENILHDPLIQKIILLLQASREPGNNELLGKVLHIDFLGLDSVARYEALAAASRRRLSLARALADPKNSLNNFYRQLLGWHKKSTQLGPLEFFEFLIHEAGVVRYLLAEPDNAVLLEKTRLFFEQLKTVAESHAVYQLDDFLAHLVITERYRLPLGGITRGFNRGVSLMTAHKAKGLEFDAVYIIGAADGHFGNRRDRKLFQLPVRGLLNEEQDDDERRLFYVALTRAREQIGLSYAAKTTTGDERLPTRFLEEIDPKLIRFEDTTKFETSWQLTGWTKTRAKKIGPAIHDREFVASTFAEQGFSVTALNNYLACPWKYFFVNLLRLPQAETKHQLYGTAVHETLRDFFTAYKTGADWPKQKLLATFARHLRAKPFTRADLVAAKTKGEKALSGYYDTYQKTWSRHLLTELKIAEVELGKGIRLVGKLDKLEIGDAGREVVVTDYKTSQPKTRNEIEGKTKSSTGDLKRQLVFYQILLNYFAKGKYKMVEGVIDFIEPDARGRYKKESFAITDTETKELETLIKKTATAILTLSFWNTHCPNPTCDFCALRKMM